MPFVVRVSEQDSEERYRLIGVMGPRVFFSTRPEEIHGDLIPKLLQHVRYIRSACRIGEQHMFEIGGAHP